MLKRIIWLALAIATLGAVAGGMFLFWGYYYVTRDMPNLTKVEDYRPPLISRVFAADGSVIAEFYRERREPLTLSEVPLKVRQAFLAAEDANFYSHPGIDPISILRAFVKNLQAGEVRQGGSTITQQVVKNLLLSEERKFTRKIKEAILSYQIEQRLSKDEILQIYLNQIFFGNTAYGLKAAARYYFHKDLQQINVAEAALLAGLPKAPTRYSPLLHFKRAKKRQKYVLDQMAKASFITVAEADQAFEQELALFSAGQENVFASPYYVGEVRRQLLEKWRDLDIDADGLSIYTWVDPEAEKFALSAMHKGLKEVDKRRGWRGPLDSGLSQEDYQSRFGAKLPKQIQVNDAAPALVLDVNRSSGQAQVLIGEQRGKLDLKQAVWLRKRLASDDRAYWIKPEEVLRRGDVIEVSVETAPPAAPQPIENLAVDQTPEIEGALVLLDPHSGKVVSMVGGYGYQRSQFNRVTQSLRQPGSAFKPLVYLAAVDGFKYTPATIVSDAPRTFKVGDEFWTPANFDEKFLGPITLRTALEKSRNLVSADLVSRIGVDAVIRYAKRLGISSKLGRNLSLALGSSEVTLLELSRAYGVLAARGVLFDTTLISKIVSRDGEVIYDYENVKFGQVSQVIPASSAFVMANLMKGVVEHGTGYRVKELGRPVAGKTGTSNDQMDTWFIGYTPEWVCGVWVGFDVKREIGEKETGGRVAAPIFLYFMRDFLKARDESAYAKLVEDGKADAERLGIVYQAPEALAPLDFVVPEGVEPFWVDKDTGYLSDQSNPNAILEYFVSGTQPSSLDHQDANSYLDSPDL